MSFAVRHIRKIHYRGNRHAAAAIAYLDQLDCEVPHEIFGIGQVVAYLKLLLGRCSALARHVHVQGKLADYRVHLGSATIHIEPGAYLCVVPDGAGLRRDKLFLPFEEGGNDLKTSEVVSKVLLLAEDARIKDESILRQIRWH